MSDGAAVARKKRRLQVMQAQRHRQIQPRLHCHDSAHVLKARNGQRQRPGAELFNGLPQFRRLPFDFRLRRVRRPHYRRLKLTHHATFPTFRASRAPPPFQSAA